LLAAALLVAPSVLPAASTDPIVVLQPGQRRELVPILRGDSELLYLDQVIAGLGLSVVNDRAAGTVTLRMGGREAILYHRKSLVSVSGDLRLLSAPALLDEGRWLLPVDGVPRILGPLLAEPVDWRPLARVLVVGKVSIPKLGVATFVSGEQVRVVLEASEKVPFQVQQEEGRVHVRIARDILQVDFQRERLTGGIVDSVEFVGGRDNLFTMALGKRFQQLKASEQDAPARLVLDFQAAPLAPRASATPAASPAPDAGVAPVRTPGPLVVVLDPGHGGEEVGAQGAGGALEKDVTLAIARKLRAAITNSLGFQVFLTRDRDVDVPLDQRAAIANNYKADLFLSIHANASRARVVSGSEVYFLAYQASDDDSRRVALAEGGELTPPGTPASGAGDLALILWDMAQAEHLEESSALASRIQEELAGVTGSQGRGVKQAPFRVLVGAAMPAVLVEVAFISHPEEEKLLTSEAYQNNVAAALMRGIRRYGDERERRLGRAASGRREGS
jgi:N-acetylmuramoyl-L-alanine amidase